MGRGLAMTDSLCKRGTIVQQRDKFCINVIDFFAENIDRLISTQ
jgi:hypothetical protein